MSEVFDLAAVEARAMEEGTLRFKKFYRRIRAFLFTLAAICFVGQIVSWSIEHKWFSETTQAAARSTNSTQVPYSTQPATTTRAYPCDQPGYLNTIYIPIGSSKLLTLRGPNETVTVCVPGTGRAHFDRLDIRQAFAADIFRSSNKKWERFTFLANDPSRKKLPNSTKITFQALGISPAEIFDITVRIEQL